MKLKKILAEIPLELYRGNKECEISGICTHSKRVAPGDLFIDKRGGEEGALHIEEAIAHGAAAILTDHPNPFLKQVVQLISPAISSIEGSLAAAFFGHPSKEMPVIGITGTSGKTTTSYLVKHLLDSLGVPSGLIGTVEYIMGTHRVPAERTTPEVVDNHRMLREMIKQGCMAAVMEVTSHGLDQGRVDEIGFDCAVFTNLSQDHLDYHASLKAYAEVKAQLFSSLSKNKQAIINRDSEWSPCMVQHCKAPIFTYGFSPGADLRAANIQFSCSQTTFDVHFKDQIVPFVWSQIGRFNVSNCLAALSVLLYRGFSLESLVPSVATFSGVPGRLERVGRSNVFVDYAHKPDALEKVLECLKELKSKRIITVFGCGGDRDRGKRPLMASIAEAGSDVVIVTSDNPRSEDPEAIGREICKGFKRTNYIVELDRRSAIHKAIELADKEDLILIAGKGHETYQIFGNLTRPFDDRKVAEQMLGLT